MGEGEGSFFIFYVMSCDLNVLGCILEEIVIYNNKVKVKFNKEVCICVGKNKKICNFFWVMWLG